MKSLKFIVLLILSGCAGGFGAIGTLTHDAVAEDTGVYQVRLIDKDVAEEEIIGTKQSCNN
ncbi:MAG: hypothetical protein ABL857_08660 [Rickettsiales bacterium]